MSFYDYTPMRRVADTPSEFVRRYQAIDQEGGTAQSAARASSLASSYESARNAYLWRCGVPFCHPALQFPFLFFYLEDSSSEGGPICYHSPFLHENRYTNRISKETFPAFLVNVCAIPYTPGDKAEQFFAALEALVRCAPRGRLRLIQEELQMLSPFYTQWQQLQSSIRMSKDKNLFVTAETVPAAAGPAASGAYLSVFQLPPEHYLPAPLMRQYLEAYRSQAGEDYAPIPEIRVQPHTLLYCTQRAEGPSLLSAVYRPESNSFALRPQTQALFNVKALPLEGRFASGCLPDGIRPLFQRLCSSSAQTLDQLAQVLAQTMEADGEGGLTVFYTRQHKRLLQSLLEQLFGAAAVPPQVFTKHPKAEDELPSLNQLTKSDNLIQLFLGQSRGAGAVLVSDLAPSDVSLQTVRKLLGGKELSLSSPSCPPQHFCSRLHLLCVTDRLDRVQLFEKKLKAQVVDLSCAEQPDASPLQLFPEELHWLRTSFLLHGLKLHTLRALASNGVSSPPQPPAALSLRDVILDFLSQECEMGEGMCCDTAQLYQGFLQFHLRRHPGAEVPISKICFNKEVRRLIDQTKASSIQYKKLRPAPKEPPRWYYVGLALAQAGGPVSSAPIQVPSQGPSLEQRLLEIHQNRLPL